jgi:2OG-Fe(II) oxygenase superfamily
MNIDTARLHRTFVEAKPFPNVVIENFVEPAEARTIANAYPTFANARHMGFSFNAVNERRKVQVTDRARFPEAVGSLADRLVSPEFVEQLSAITGVPNLLADPTFFGGGMHVTGPHGRLDVHVDFNLFGALYRRVNLLLYLNPQWREEWGGQIELWDAEVKHCGLRLTPDLGRCLIFEASDVSFHGVSPLKCPDDVARRSFAAYYYTDESPPAGIRNVHGTVFRARPDERLRELVLMPAEQAQRAVVETVKTVRRRARRLASRLIRGQ